MGLYFASPWATDALERAGHWETAIRLAAGHHIHLTALGREGPYKATAGHSLTAQVDLDPLRAVQLAVDWSIARKARVAPPSEAELRALAGDR